MDASIRRLSENEGLAFPGAIVIRRRMLPASLAARLLAARNPHGKSNRDVLRPRAGAADILGLPLDRWMIDLPPGMDRREAALYELPYARIRASERGRSGRRSKAGPEYGTRAAELRVALAKPERFLATPAAGQLRVLAWLPPEVLPDRSLVVFARDDDWFFGVLHSRLHEAWTLRAGTRLRGKSSAFRYTPTACFESFPFPWPPGTPLRKLSRAQEDHRTAIGLAARTLDLQRREWLGDRSDPKCTLTALYDAKPTWLRDVHTGLDEAVAAAYGWPADLPDDEVVSRLLALNRKRAGPPDQAPPAEDHLSTNS